MGREPESSSERMGSDGGPEGDSFSVSAWA